MCTMPATNPELPLTRAGAVTAELRRLIRSGEIPPGTRLRQVEIAERFRVSTTPVREAFAALAREGLVRQDSHRGVVVFEPSVEELDEIYRIRELLEPWATELAAKRLSPEEVAALVEIVDEMRDAEPARYAELNRSFHGLIYAGAGLPRLDAIIDGLRSAASSYLGMTVTQYDDRYRQQVHKEHQQILALVRDGTPKQAGRAVRDHLRHNAEHVAALIETSE
jgi:DNA-binding GntR family transcriptional regulator